MISDNIMIAFEAHQYLKKKRQGKDGFTTLKLDMSKAFDQVEWPFLHAMLSKLVFDNRWNVSPPLTTTSPMKAI